MQEVEYLADCIIILGNKKIAVSMYKDEIIEKYDFVTQFIENYI